MKRANYLELIQWGDWWVRHQDFTGFADINTVEKYFYQPGRTAQPGHRVLTPDMPRRLQAIERAVHKLSDREQAVVRIKYCAPLRQDGVIYTHRELARLLGVSQEAFDKALSRGRRKVMGWLE